MGKRWIDIWLVLINLDFEMRFDNFTRATCILYTDLVENLKFTGKRWIDIWLVFINLNFEMRFDNFTGATCILYINFVENLNFLPSQCKKYKLHVQN